MPCSFTLSNEGITYELWAEKTAGDHTFETWRVFSRLDASAFIELANDRPSLHTQHQYTTRYTWTVKEGVPQYRKMVQQITTWLEYHIKGQWKPARKGKPTLQRAEPSTQGKLF